MRFELEDVARIVGGHGPTPGDAIGGVDGASIDSRSILPGQLFVALRAERDGHEFIADAAGCGAGAALVDHSVPGDLPMVVVDDVRSALTDLAHAARSRLDGTVVGITGSVGKTTTKDLLAAVLGQLGPVGASVRSFNNELGVPLTLLCTPDAASSAVIEMGARGLGHVSSLCRIAKPNVAIVTTVAAAHLEMFGSIEAIAEAKGELVESVPAEGLAVLNADVGLVREMSARSVARVLTFGVAGEVGAERVDLDDELRPSFRLRSPWGSADVVLGVRGVHNVGNALAAAAAALGTDVPMDLVVQGLATRALSPWRMEFLRSDRGGVVLNDAYNANPESMAAALRSVAAVVAHRRVAVLGPMAELGDSSVAEHATIAALASDLDIEIVAVGTDGYGVAPVSIDAVAGLVGEVGPGVAVLVKGSRVGGLEVVASSLSGRRSQ